MHNKQPVLDRCQCSECSKKFFTAKLETMEESEGWEYPTYTIRLCPTCPDGGCIDNYWPSSKAMREWKPLNPNIPPPQRISFLNKLLRN